LKNAKDGRETMGMSHEDRQWFQAQIDAVKRELREDNRAMEGRIVIQIRDLREVSTKRLDDHSRRLRALETSRAYVAGIGATIAFAATWIKDLITGRGGP